MTNFLTSLDLSRIRNGECGDWRYDEHHIWAMSAKMSDPRSELAVQIHELIEAFKCREDKITDAVVTAHDEKCNKERIAGLRRPEDESGDDELAPYRVQHQAATNVERAVCDALGLSWEQHEKNVNALFEVGNA